MLDILFGWRKASKCKRLIRRVQCRLKLLKNKRYSIVRQLREDVAQLIKTGYEEIAIDRAEQLFKDESIMSFYELLDHFCEFILIRLSYIRRHRDCPNDINEAISSLVYASARCGDLPELRAIRKLFGERYGDSFVKGALELCPGNLVNSEIRDKLSAKSVSEDDKLRMVDEISQDYSLRPEILALEYASELQRQMKEIMEPHVIDANATLFQDKIEEPKLQVSEPKALEAKSVLVDSTTSMISSLDSEEHKVKKITVKSWSSSSSNSPQISLEKIVYLDDVEEVRSSNLNSQDQRVFKFRPFLIPGRDTPKDGYISESDSQDESSASKSLRKSKRGPEKRIRRRSRTRDVPSMETSECVAYYNGPIQQRTKHQKKDSVNSFCSESKDCSLDHPCYDHVLEEKDNPRDVTTNQTVSDIKFAALPMKMEKVCNESVSVVYDVFTYPDYEKKVKESFDGSECSSSEEEEEGVGLYLRALTMPPERAKEKHEEKNIPVRSNSCPFQYPNHVHPKLPDYDEIAAKFSALKKEYRQGKDQCFKQAKQ